MVMITIQLDNGNAIQYEVENATKVALREQIAKVLLSDDDWVALSTDDEKMLIDKKHIVCVMFK